MEYRATIGLPSNRYGEHDWGGGTGTSGGWVHYGGDANAGVQRNERGRQRNVGLSSVPALCRPFKLSVPPCLETPCKYVCNSASAAAVAYKYSFFSFFPFVVYLFSFFFHSRHPCACVFSASTRLPLPSPLAPQASLVAGVLLVGRR